MLAALPSASLTLTWVVPPVARRRRQLVGHRPGRPHLLRGDHGLGERDGVLGRAGGRRPARSLLQLEEPERHQLAAEGRRRVGEEAVPAPLHRQRRALDHRVAA